MHPSRMLGEQILAVELVRARLPIAVVGFVLRTAFAEVAFPGFEVEMLHAHVPSPFVLAAEDAGAAVACEDAGERAAVLGQDVFI